jgi:hypothetical protein
VILLARGRGDHCCIRQSEDRRPSLTFGAVSELDDVPLYSELSYASLAVGDRWGPFADTIDQETSDGLRGALGQPRPGATAPLGVLPLLTLRALRRALCGIIPGGVLVRQRFCAVDTLPAQGRVDIEVWVSAQQRRPSGLYTTFAFGLSSGGRTPALVEWTILAPAGA